MQDIGPRIRELRKVHGLSQQALADRSGVARQTLNTVEQGKHMPSMRTLQRLADGLGVDIGTFFRKAL